MTTSNHINHTNTNFITPALREYMYSIKNRIVTAAIDNRFRSVMLGTRYFNEYLGDLIHINIIPCNQDMCLDDFTFKDLMSHDSLLS